MADLGWRELGIPLRETHAVEGYPPDPRRMRYPHRSRWSLIPHRGHNCLWARVRVPKRRTAL